jgi:hypothetical protein
MCGKGQLETAKWFVARYPETNISGDLAMHSAYLKIHADALKWLKTL